MWRDMVILASSFIAFLTAFAYVRWGREVRNPERRNPWIFFNPGGGGS